MDDNNGTWGYRLQRPIEQRQAKPIDADGFGSVVFIFCLLMALIAMTAGMDYVTASANAYYPGSGWYVGVAILSAIVIGFAFFVLRAAVRMVRS